MIRTIDGAAQERAKYAEIWSTVPEYRNYSPGLVNVDRFMEVMPGIAKYQLGLSFHGGIDKPRLVDIGCGAGVAGLEFQKRGFHVDFIDITDAGLSPEINRIQFKEAPLWSAWGNRLSWDYGFCCDVMEHIPPEYTMLVIDRILTYCEVAWFQIALRPDEFGKAIGEPLHLTVQPYQWWLIRLASLGEILDARDLCGDGLYVVRRK